MEFISISEVRKKFKKEKSAFHKSYFDTYNNPQRSLGTYEINKERIDNLIVSGKMTPKLNDFFRGKTQALEDRGLI
jgi:hypothetical protein